MGLIHAAIGSVGGVMADQWKDYFYCEAIPDNVIVLKGRKRVSGRSTNRNGSDNIITSGSVIAVADGQCMIIVEQGKVVDLCAEPGEYTYDASSQASLFAGSLSESIPAVFRQIGINFSFGGENPMDQRIYYFNTRELMGNKYGTPAPVPFRVVDTRAGIDIDVGVRCFGEYSYRVTNPILFYTNVCGNVSDSYTRSRLDAQLKSELLTALQPAFARISEQGIRYSSLPGHTMELADALNAVLSAKWRDLRGIEIVSFGVNSVTAIEEDEKMLKELQRNAAFRDPSLAAAQMAGATASAMQTAAGNAGGAVNGFMGMNMVQGGGVNLQNLYAMGQQQAAPAAGNWKCSCGAENTGRFCSECGAKKPEDGWKCTCGAVNKGRFCSECGAKKPEGVPQYRCDKCGWEPEKGAAPPKFCPECGDPFDNGDIV